MPTTRQISTRLVPIASLVAAALLLSACSSSSTAQPTSPTSTPSSMTTAATSAAGDGTSTASSTGSTSGSQPAVITGTTSVPLSSRSSRPAPSTPEPSGSAAVGSFNSTTVQYFAALCSGLQDKPRDLYAGLTGDLATKRTRTVALFNQQAERLDGAAEAMKAAGVPAIPQGARLASVTIATYPKMADAAVAGARLVATATSAADLDAKVGRASEAIDTANEPLQALGEIVGAPAVVGQMKKIAMCASVLTG